MRRQSIQTVCAFGIALWGTVQGVADKAEGELITVDEAAEVRALKGAKPMLMCPPGFSMSSGSCMRVEYREAILSCPKHADSIEGGYCLVRSEIGGLQQCPAGYLYDGKRCYAEVPETAEVSCPKGYNLDETVHGCTRRRKTKADSICPAGYLSSHKGCELRKESAPLEICPEGYSLDPAAGKKNRCLALDVVPSILDCPKNYNMEGGFCINKDVRDLIPSKCPKKTVSDGNGNCVSVTEVPAVYVCDKHAVLDEKKGHCTVMQERPLVPHCEKGFDFVDGRCKRVDRFVPKFDCPKGFHLAEGKCVNEQSVAANLSCPPGSIAHSDHCYAMEHIEPETYCKHGVADGGVCSHTDVKEPTFDCPHGFRFDGKKCLLKKKEKGELVCGPDATLQGKHCIRTVAIAAQPSCPAGLDMTPQGCKGARRSKINFSCPDGYKKQHNTCVAEFSTPSMFLCPEGTKLVGERCVGATTIPAELRCPKRFEMAGNGKCVSTSVSDPILRCPQGHKLHDSMCVPSGHGSKH